MLSGRIHTVRQVCGRARTVFRMDSLWLETLAGHRSVARTCAAGQQFNLGVKSLFCRVVVQRLRDVLDLVGVRSDGLTRRKVRTRRVPTVHNHRDAR